MNHNISMFILLTFDRVSEIPADRRIDQTFESPWHCRRFT